MSEEHRGFTATDLARALAKGGVPYSTASARVQNYAKNGWLREMPREIKAPNSAKIFQTEAVFVAKILSGLHDAGVADRDVMFDAAGACMFFDARCYLTIPSKGSPIANAVKAVALDNEKWVLRMQFWNCTKTDSRHVIAWFCRDGDFQKPLFGSSENLLMSSIEIHLEPHVDRINRILGIYGADIRRMVNLTS